MKTLNLVQGTPEWLANRATLKNASEASMMMGVHSNVSRDEFIRLVATGSDQEFSDFVQRFVLDRGHEVEDLARPFVESRIGDDLFPVVGVSDDGILGASLDGFTFDGVINWECKQMNKDKLADVLGGRVPECDRWQVVQQLVVSGAEYAIYTVSDGTEENTHSVEYRLAKDDEKRLRAGWAQFDLDVDAYKAKLEAGDVVVAPSPVAEVIEELPAVSYRMDGLALTSNLDAFKVQARSLIEKSKEPLETDNDFATAESLIKVFKSAEDALGSKSDQVVGEVADVDRFIKDVKAIKEEMRQARLAAEKLVQAEKDRRRVNIASNAEKELAAFILVKEQELADALGMPVKMPKYDANFSAAMKGKRNIESIQSAVNTVLATAKNDLTILAETMNGNIKSFQALADGYVSLFSDIDSLLVKDEDDFSGVVRARIADFETEKAETEAKRLAAEKAEADRVAAEVEAKAIENAKAADEFVADAVESVLEDAAQVHTASVKPRSSTMAIARPSDSEMVQVIASHYGVSFDVAAGWVRSMKVAA